jgi:hypothetical protein
MLTEKYHFKNTAGKLNMADQHRGIKRYPSCAVNGDRHGDNFVII